MALPLSAEAPALGLPAASLHTARANHAAAALPNGQALIVAGSAVQARRSRRAEIFNLSE